jgi:hypothetical protein
MCSGPLVRPKLFPRRNQKFCVSVIRPESGIVSIFGTERGQIAKLADVNVGPNAHVVAVDSATHRSYFPLKNAGGRTALRIMRPGAQPGP